MSARHAGKVAVVTGAARGIGSAIAERFAQDGARVAILDVEADAGEATVASLRSISDDAMFVRCNVGLKAEVDAAFAEVASRFGRVDILMNNAGINRSVDLLDLPEADWDLVIQTNLKSMFLCTQAAGRRMRDQGTGGAIVNMASTSVSMTMPLIAAYAASKGGIASFTVASSLALAPHGIRVNAVSPGTIETEMTRERLIENKDNLERILSRTPLGRVGQGADVASVASFLASDEAGYVTGQNVYIDGGRKGLNYTVPVTREALHPSREPQ